MEEKKTNFNQEEVAELINSFPLQPRQNFVYVTMNRVTEEDEDLILEEQYVSEEQYVIAVGPRVQDLEPGMKVLLDPEKMTKYIQDPHDVHTKIPTLNAIPIEIDNYLVARISDNIIHSIDYR